MIVVGVDGSKEGLAAVSWAVREAAMRGLRVRVVNVVPTWAEMPRDDLHAYLGRWMRESAMSVLEDARRQARGETPRVEVETELLHGDPRLSLIKAAGDAELLVVGNHGLGGFRGALLGSVALGVPGQANCPVAVVREMPAQPRGEVVVGVDGSPGGAAVVELAFAEAELRGAGLRAVHVWGGSRTGSRTGPLTGPLTGLFGGPRTGFFTTLSTGGASGPGTAGAAGGQAAVERLLLAEAVAGQGERHPGVKLVEHLERGHPVEVLTEASIGADLLVVGSRGRGDVAGLLLGSVSHSLLHHVRCPLIVVPVGSTAEGGE